MYLDDRIATDRESEHKYFATLRAPGRVPFGLCWRVQFRRAECRDIASGSESVVLNATCCVPCGDGAVAVDSDECGKLACGCCCLAVCAMGACQGRCC